MARSYSFYRLNYSPPIWGVQGLLPDDCLPDDCGLATRGLLNINRRHYLPRLLLTLSLKYENKSHPTDLQLLTGSHHINFRVAHDPPRTHLSDTRGAFWSYTSCDFKFNLLKAYEDPAEGRYVQLNRELAFMWAISRLAGGFCEATFRFRYYDGDQSNDCFEEGDTKGRETKMVEA